MSKTTSKLYTILKKTCLVLFPLLFFLNSVRAQSSDCDAGSYMLTVGTTHTGYIGGATASAGVPASPCIIGGNQYDVWYRFTATAGTSYNITISNYGAFFAYRQLFVYKGVCGALSQIACTGVSSTPATGPLTLPFHDYSHDAVYYIRVVYPTPGLNGLTNKNFDILVSASGSGNIGANPPVVTGKSYVNLSKPGGGTMENGNILEIRSTIAVGNDNFINIGNIYNTSFYDTIPAGFSYVPNSIRFETNEGLQFESAITGVVSLTDASGDDEAVYSGGRLRVNVTSLPRKGGAGVFPTITDLQQIAEVSPAVSPITYDASGGGGKVSARGRPNQFSSYTIIMVTYRVQITAAAGTNVTTSNGAFRYTTGTSNTGVAQTIANLQAFTIYISPDAGSLCNNFLGANVYINGNFGSGNVWNDATQSGTAPGFTWRVMGGSAPGGPVDGQFTIANNSSIDQSVNKYISLPNATSRLFKDWDIIGDHTNALNADSGNFATPVGATGGYMALINAAYGSSNAIQRTITGLCPDTYYEFSAWVKNICAACSSDSTGIAYDNAINPAAFKSYLPVKTLNDSAGVNPDITFTIDGIDHYTSGQIVYDRRWVKRGFSFRTGPAQSSITLTIRNNAPGGGGNDWALDDISFATCLPSLQMRPNNAPAYCINGQINLSVITSAANNNYSLYQWERSTDGGVTWLAAPALSGVRTYSYAFNGTNYIDTVAYPTIVATPAMNGHRYRVRTGSSLSNLGVSSCAVYATDVIIIGVNSGCTVLSSELLGFNAKLNNNNYTELTWVTKQQNDLQGYGIERSTDGRHFTKIGYIAARNGTATERYTFTDIDAVTGKVYYRLQLIQEGNTGNKYSNILSVSANGYNKFELSNLVNPFDTKISFQVTIPQNETVEIQLMDAMGKPVYQQQMKINKGANTVNFEAPAHLQRGNYLLRVVSGSGTVNKVIQKL